MASESKARLEIHADPLPAPISVTRLGTAYAFAKISLIAASLAELRESQPGNARTQNCLTAFAPFHPATHSANWSPCPSNAHKLRIAEPLFASSVNPQRSRHSKPSSTPHARRSAAVGMGPEIPGRSFRQVPGKFKRTHEQWRYGIVGHRFRGCSQLFRRSPSAASAPSVHQTLLGLNCSLPSPDLFLFGQWYTSALISVIALAPKPQPRTLRKAVLLALLAAPSRVVRVRHNFVTCICHIK